MLAEFKEGKKKELEQTLKQWKKFVESHGKKYEHYDLTNDSWWVRTGEIIRKTISELEETTEPERIRMLLKIIFDMGKNRVLWSQNVRLIVTFLNTATPEELENLRQLLISMKHASTFDSKWIDEFYNVLKNQNPEKVSNFKALKGLLRNILGELYGKLHVDEAPVYNTCSRKFISQYFDFNKDDYEDFKDAFEKLKDEYRQVVGKLSDDNVPINAEIDMMFNCFDKDPGGCKVESEENGYHNFIDYLLNKKGQVILYGPPGTGKTWLARNYVVEKTGEEKPGNRWEFITFHQSYSYEEFIEGFRPRTGGEKGNEITYVVEDGIFKKMAIKAIVVGLLNSQQHLDRDTVRVLNRLNDLLDKYNEENFDYKEYQNMKKQLWEFIKGLDKEKIRGIFENGTKDHEFYIIIDEINRGNISKILGELITLLEKDKRLGGENQLIVTLPYSGEPFTVPPNLYIIGTMNTADRSIALLDVALRRRFSFLEIEPKPEKLKDKNNIEGINLEELLKKLNIKIEAIKDRDHRIGHSYFLEVRDLEGLHFVWYYEIVPLLMEYFYNDWESLAWLLGDGFLEDKLNEGNKKLQFKKPSLDIGNHIEPGRPYGIKFYDISKEQEKENFREALKWILDSVKEEQSGG